MSEKLLETPTVVIAAEPTVFHSIRASGVTPPVPSVKSDTDESGQAQYIRIRPGVSFAFSLKLQRLRLDERFSQTILFLVRSMLTLERNKL